MPLSRVILVVAFAAVLVVPYALRPPEETPPPDALPLVIVTPHVQTIWYEFERAFSAWHQRHYGKPVDIDWRQPGGTSTILQFLNARFSAVDALPGGAGGGIGIDLFFGGGQYDYEQQKKAGHLEPCGIRTEHPELLAPEILPQTLSGAVVYDKDDFYYGTCFSAFGIVANTEAMMRQRLPRDLIPPQQWRDLTSPALFRKVVTVDPGISASIVKAYEMLIQQAIGETVEARRASSGASSLDPAAERAAVADGFWAGIRRIQLIGANARRVGRMSSEAPIDVSLGEGLAAMCIDYYGLVQAEAASRPDGSSRLTYVTPVGGSGADSDPIALLRGAPNREVARRFIHFCLTVEGQKLWCYRAGTPGGPVKYTLHRPPIRRDLYADDHLRHFADPDNQPYTIARSFTYRPEWTGPLFTFIRIFVRALCIDTQDELREAWRAVIDNGQAYPDSPAMQVLQRMPLRYEDLFEEAFRSRLRDPVEIVALTREWGRFFRANYAEAARLARDAGRTR